MNKINICIAGLGNVGSALVQLIEKNSELVDLKPSEIDIKIPKKISKDLIKKIDLLVKI